MKTWVAALVLLMASCGSEATPTGSAPNLNGTYTSEISLEEFPKSFPATSDFDGEWTLIIDGDDLELDFPGSGNFHAGLVVNEGSIVVEQVAAPEGAFNCYEADGTRLSGEVPGTYSLTKTEGGFSLEPQERDPCEVRAVILTRDWAEG
jgi:hypothetical protein